MTAPAILSEARTAFHASLLDNLLHDDLKGVPTNADKDSKVSVKIAAALLKQLGNPTPAPRLAGQEAGKKFEQICCQFLQATFPRLAHMRPGSWVIKRNPVSQRLGIASFDQYSHLRDLEKLAKENSELAAALGTDYAIAPDVVIIRQPAEDIEINAQENLVDLENARMTSIRKVNSPLPTLHASVSCKWTLRSDRAQNARSEGLNLVRNRKGKLPHIAVVVGEPVPSRIASLALGTGDIDCVYHFALPELQRAVHSLGFSDAEEMIAIMVDGKRLRDISDLPLDLEI